MLLRLFFLICFALALVLSACGTESATCDPECTAEEVCIDEGGLKCMLKCETDDDCTEEKAGMADLVCHDDSSAKHCGEKGE